MADQALVAPVFKTKPAVTRKHLKRDQAAARKARGAANVGDSLKDRQVLCFCKRDKSLSYLEPDIDFSVGKTEGREGG